MKSLYSRIEEAQTEEELRELNKEIVEVGRITGMHGFKPLQEVYMKRLGELKSKGCS